MLNVGDKIRILEDRHWNARVFEGDVLEVLRVGEGWFHTEAPCLDEAGFGDDAYWGFEFNQEGTGWEKVEEDQ